MFRSHLKFALISLSSMGLLMAWEVAGLDVPLAHLHGGAQGFPLRHHWLLTTVMHDSARWVGWLLIVVLCLGVAWPAGVLTRLSFAQRMQWPATALLCVAAVALLKAGNHTSCPWDLEAFGGSAQPLSHWMGWLRPDRGAGHCFPAGHAGTGFAFIGGYFAMRSRAPGAARLCLTLSLALGLALGVAQQWRGAHFMSHTLWTGWLCWTLSWVVDAVLQPGQLGAGRFAETAEALS